MGQKMVAAPHWMSVMNFMNDVVGILARWKYLESGLFEVWEWG
jgi:hypothetical protein